MKHLNKRLLALLLVDVLLSVDGTDELVLNLVGTHLRLEVVGSHLRRSHENAVLALVRRFATAV